MLALLQDIQDVAQDVTGLLADVLVKQYPGLCVAIRATSSMILNNAFDDVKQKLSGIEWRYPVGLSLRYVAMQFL